MQLRDIPYRKVYFE